MTRQATFDDHLVKLRDAPARVGRSRATIYRWIKEGRVKVLHPGREKYLFVADLMRAEQETGGRGLR